MINWKSLKREVQIFIGALLFALLLVGVLLFMQQKIYNQWQQTHNQLQQANLRFQTASDQKLILEQYQQRFATLKSAHIMGEEQRIDWVEAIQSSSTRHAIPSVKFILNQRSSVALPDDVTGIAVYVSQMQLDMNLLHEGDLYNLFADLDNSAQGLYGIKSCALKQEGRQTIASTFTSSLNGTCELYWYTLSEPVEQQYDEYGEPIAPEAAMENNGEEI